MADNVRAVADFAEFVQCVAAAQVAFHLDRSAHEEAMYRRDVLDQDLSRTLAAMDGQRVVGTLYSFAAPLTAPGGAQGVAVWLKSIWPPLPEVSKVGRC